MKPFDQIDDLGNVRTLDAPARALGAMSAALPAGKVRAALAGEPLGHSAHPMLVQIPIGAWVSAGWLDCLPRTENSAAVLTGVGIVSAIPAIAAGLVDYADLSERQRRIAVVHATANALALVCQVVSLRDRMSGRLRRGQWIGFAGTSLLAVGGLLGGHLAHAQTAATD
ncbi:MAG: hypothetical protein LC779_01810 [Actinobacteria bacterium]|nr:hypothetical protein [Actinomycetota bacterium]